MLVNKTDLEHVKTLLSDGYDTFLVELLKTADELHDLLNAMLETSLQHERIHDVLIKAHGLKSVGRQCGLEDLGALAREMERTAKENTQDMSSYDAETWERLRMDYIETLAETRAALSEYAGR